MGNTTVLNINIDEIDAKFVEALKRDFAHAAVEIRLQGQPAQSADFTESDFWNAITLLDWNHDGYDEAVVAPLIKYLAEQPISHIYRFSDLLAEKLWHLDTRAHAKVFLDDPEEGGILSVDDFLYARCAVVANGREYFDKVFHHPESMPRDLTFEPLLYVAMKAFQQKTGRNFIPVHAYNYETYSNKKGWE